MSLCLSENILPKEHFLGTKASKIENKNLGVCKNNTFIDNLTIIGGIKNVFLQRSSAKFFSEFLILFVTQSLIKNC